MQLIDRHLHGGLIHFGVHYSGSRGAVVGLSGCGAPLRDRLWRSSQALELGVGCSADPEPGKHFQAGVEGKWLQGCHLVCHKLHSRQSNPDSEIISAPASLYRRSQLRHMASGAMQISPVLGYVAQLNHIPSLNLSQGL